MKKLPIGIQTFRTLIEGGFLYVDKTSLIYQMIQEGVGYFFSRPRRFGKSLLVSVLGSLFRGDRDLFADTWIDKSNYPWTSHAVLTLNFSRLNGASPETLLNSLNDYLCELAKGFDVALEKQTTPADTLVKLIYELQRVRPVVLLIDEYDFPLLQHLDKPLLVEELRGALHHFFAVIKSLEGSLRFVFITGVTKFSKVSLFSGMNNLNDISLDPRYATLLGITHAELECFEPHIARVAQSRGQSPEAVSEQMHDWYNGYLFSQSPLSERVFNPWSLLNYLHTAFRRNYWFSTGTPTFAVQLLKARDLAIADLDTGIEAGDEIESAHNPETIDLLALLFQTGYLTIDTYDEETGTYFLKLPNEEVRRSLFKHLFAAYSGMEAWKSKRLLHQLIQALLKGNLEAFFAGFNTLLASIPYPLHSAQESYYHSLIYLCIRLLGFEAHAEVMTSDGRIDLVVKSENALYLFEFKIDAPAQAALEQIRSKGYMTPYLDRETEIVLVGASISSKSRKVEEWLQQQAAHFL